MQENKASRVFLVAAVVLGLLATGMAFVFIQAQAGKDTGPKMMVVVASHDLRPRVALDPERDLKVTEIPQKFGQMKYMTLDPAALASYKGEKLNRRVDSGQPIFLTDLAAGGELEFPTANTRAMTITVASGPAIPGDYVKIITANGTILAGGQEFRIVMIDGVMRMFRQPATIGEQSNNTRGSHAVTLDVTEAQAAEILKGMGTSADKNLLLICPPPPETASQPSP